MNNRLASDLVKNFINGLPSSSTTGYTDGAVSSNGEVTSCACYFPEPVIEKAWRLTKGSNILTAELYGIYKALETWYNHTQESANLFILTDSKSAIQAINAVPRELKHEIALEIWNIMSCLLASGTKTHLVWVPSHVGIAGNEHADKLATEEVNSNPTNIIRNRLGPLE